MTEKQDNNNQSTPDSKKELDEWYGWDFHKWPVIASIILVSICYILIYIFVKNPSPIQ